MGDTLLALALALDIELIELRDGNCMSQVSGILAGDTVYVPKLPELPLMAPQPVFPPIEQEFQRLGCSSPNAQIISPAPGSTLSGIFEVIGRVISSAQGGYEISVKPAWSEAFHKLLIGDMPDAKNVIGLVNTEIFGPGLHRLKLELVDRDGAPVAGSVCDIPIIFQAP